jgi:acetyl esterase/lipase
MLDSGWYGKSELVRATVVAFLCMLISGLLGCSRMALLNAPVPTQDLQVERGISYGSDSRMALNVYRPDDPGPHPVVVFFYGGRWRIGERDQYLFLAQSLASKGYLTVIPDYRLYPNVKYPAFLRDGARAIQWTRDRVREYGGNHDQIFLMGHSAGAYIAAMLSLHPKFLLEAGVSREVVRGTIGLAGPYDFRNLKKGTVVESVFSPAEPLETSYVTRYASHVRSPFLLVAGKRDDTVGFQRTKRFASVLKKHGGEVTTHYYPEANHVGLVLPFAYPLNSYPFGWNEPLTEDVDQFISGVLSKRKR